MNSGKPKKVIPVIVMAGIFFIVSFVKASENWMETWDNLYSEKVLSQRKPTASRLYIAEVLMDDMQQISSGEIKINRSQKRQLDELINEFRDELFLMEQKEKTNWLSHKIKSVSVTNFWSGRILANMEQSSNHPAISSDLKFSNNLYFEYSPTGIFKGVISLKTQEPLVKSFDKNLTVDEAYVSISGPAQLSVGRMYFLLDRLGLIADNYFDAFEAVKLEHSYFTVIYSRLSSTNYPYSKMMVSSDDYWAFRISNIRERELEMGFTYLASGIATEKGAGVDFHTTIGDREFVGELALYWPSKTDYTADKDAKIAGVLGVDLYKLKRKNIFLQVGSVEKGFTPMASSLIYSAGNHLYFDQDTLGCDITFTYQPKKEKEISLWETRIDRTGYFPPMTTWELEFVWLATQNLSPHSEQYILRYIHPLVNGLSLYLENIFWVRKNTILYPDTEYNQLKAVLSFNF
ncbi:MAG: hypothetical protein HY919_03590 [Elusimicrobia bacterium]|nr:hypothetical protein [Elusimicrobiota bacterium]